MATPSQHKFLRDLEETVRPQLRDVSLVGEIDYPLSAAEIAFQLHVIEHELRSPTQARRFNEQYRVSLVAAIVSASRHYYGDGSLWPVLDEVLLRKGFEKGLSEQTRAVFREVFIETLREFELPIVGDGTAHTLVHTAAMHAGIPTYCLDDWFNLTRRGRAQVSDSPSALTRWSIDNIDRPIMHDIDQPIKRMLTTAPDFAEDFFQRAIELTDYLESGHSPSELSEFAELPQDEIAHLPVGFRATEIGLHPRWASMACRNITNHGSPSGKNGSASSPASPAIRLNFAEGQVELMLPPVIGVPEDIVWGVDQGTGVVEHRAKLDTADDDVKTRSVSVPLVLPRRTVGVTVAGQRSDLPLWTEGYPAMLFTESGQQISTASGRLSVGKAWLMLPDDSDWLLNDAPANAVTQDDPPLGWPGWQLIQLQLEMGDSLTVTGRSFPEGDLTLKAQGKAGPKILLPDAVVGATAYGMSVITERPIVELPEGNASWQVSVTPYGSSRSSWSTSAKGGDRIEILDGRGAVASTYELRVRGPIGRAVRETFVLVDGLTMGSNPPVRRLDQNGILTGAKISVGAAVGLDVSTPELVLSPQTGHGTVLVSARTGESVRLRVSVPATLVALERSDSWRNWGPRPLSIDIDTLSENPILHLRLPKSHQSPDLVAFSNGVPVQTLESKRSLGGHRFELGALHDVAVEHGRLDIQLGDGQPVGRLTRFQQVKEIEYEPGGKLNLKGVESAVEGLEVWVWPTQAPWRAPQLIAADSQNNFVLPSDLTDAGDLLVHTRILDGWVTEPDPTSEVRKSRVQAPGTLSFKDDERRVHDVAFGLSDAIEASDVAIARELLQDSRAPWDWPVETHARIRAATVGESAAMLMHLSELGLADPELAWTLVRTGLHRQAISVTTEMAEELWLNSPSLAAIFAAEHLPDNELSEGLAQLWLATAVAELGDAYKEVLGSGLDRHSDAGRFCLGAIRMEASPAQMKMAVANMGLIPKGTLDPDTRVLRVVNLAKKMHSGKAKRFRYSPAQQTKQLVDGLSGRGFSTDVAGIDAVSPDSEGLDHHWLPPFIRAAAVLSRHRKLRWTPSPQAQQTLEQAAVVAPGMVIAELIRASALARAPHTQDKVAA